MSGTPENRPPCSPNGARQMTDEQAQVTQADREADTLSTRFANAQPGEERGLIAIAKALEATTDTEMGR